MGDEKIKEVAFNKTILPYKEFHFPETPCLDLTPTQSKLVSEFNQGIRDGRIQFEFVPCLCGSRSFDLIASVDRYAMLQKTVMCTQCGLVQSNPRMTDKASVDFYTSDLYRMCYEGENYLEIYKKKYDDDYAKHIFDEVNKVKKINSDCTVFELGAGGGWNLLPFKSAGAKVTGMDYSKSLVALGSQRGLDMKQGGIDDIQGVFDIIILNHVAEHFPDFTGALRKIAAHLKKGGFFYIAVPNILNFDMAQLQNAHPYHFTPETFKYYCAEAGLKLLRGGEAEGIHMFGIFQPTDELNHCSLAKNYKEMRRFFWMIRLQYILKIKQTRRLVKKILMKLGLLK